MGGMICLSLDSDTHTLVDAPFTLMSYHPNMTHFAGSCDMRAPIGLQVQPHNLDQAHPLKPFRQQVRSGTNQAGKSKHLSTWQEADTHLSVCFNLGVDTLFHLGHKIKGEPLQFEILARLVPLNCW
jgi:hypothetical protein